MARKLPSLSENVRYADPPGEDKRLFELEGTVEECMTHIGADNLLNRIKTERDVPKIEVPIVANADGSPLFSSFVQNIVITHEIEYTSDNGDTYAHAAPQHVTEYKLNLPYVARSWRFLGAQYNPQRFDSVIQRSKDYDAATLYFNSGKLVETGYSRPELALDQLLREKKMLRNILPWDLDLVSPFIQNIVSSGAFPSPICVNVMATMYPHICSKVGRFPGAMIKSTTLFGDCAILVFATGKWNHSGGRSLDHIYEHMKIVYPLFVECAATTDELVRIDEKCRTRLSKTTSSGQCMRERESLLRSIERHRKKTQNANEASPKDTKAGKKRPAASSSGPSKKKIKVTKDTKK